MAAAHARGLTACLGLSVLLSSSFLDLHAQRPQQTGMVGQVRLEGGRLPPQRVKVELRVHGSTIETTFADGGGKFGFFNLKPGGYEVVVELEGFATARKVVVIRPDLVTPANVLLILRPRKVETVKKPAGDPNAVDLAEMLLKTASPQARKQYDRGLRAAQAGDMETALRHYRRAVELAPGYYPAFNNMGTILMRQGKYDQAAEAFLQVIEIHAVDSRGYFNLGNVYLMTGDLVQSEKRIAEGLDRDPASSLGHFLMGSVLLRTGRLKGAAAYLERARGLERPSAMAWLALADAYLAQQRDAEALEVLREFVERFPIHPRARQARETVEKLEEWLRTDRESPVSVAPPRDEPAKLPFQPAGSFVFLP